MVIGTRSSSQSSKKVASSSAATSPLSIPVTSTESQDVERPTLLLRCFNARANAPKWQDRRVLFYKARNATRRKRTKRDQVFRVHLRWDELESQKDLVSRSAGWLDSNIEWKHHLKSTDRFFGHMILTKDGKSTQTPLAYVKRFPSEQRLEMNSRIAKAIVDLVTPGSPLYIPPGSQPRYAKNGFLQIIFNVAGNRATVVDHGDLSARGINVNARYRDYQEEADRFQEQFEPLRAAAEEVVIQVFPHLYHYLERLLSSNSELKEKNVLPALPFSGLCINVVDSKGKVRTVVCKPHVDDNDGKDTWCCVIPICTGGEEWPQDEFQLRLPGIKTKINLRPCDMVFFPSSLLVHYNTAGSGSQRASVVLFIHASLLLMVAANGEIPSNHPDLVVQDAEEREALKFRSQNPFYDAEIRRKQS